MTTITSSVRYQCGRCAQVFEFQHQVAEHVCPGSIEASDAFEKLTEAQANRRTYLLGVTVFAFVLAAGAVLLVAGGIATDLALPGVALSLYIIGGVFGASGVIGELMWSVHEFCQSESSFEKTHKARREYTQVKNREALHTLGAQAASSASAASGVQSVQLERGQ